MVDCMVRRSNSRHQRIDEDPMAGATNLVDAMLVIAVGFLVFIVISWNMNAMIDPNQDIQDQIHQKMSEVSQGQEIGEIPDSQKSSMGEGYNEMGKVYQDPKTGKLIMVEG